jgi:TolB protein
VGSRWSPDGSRIAFTSDHENDPGIYLMNTDGMAQRLLSAGVEPAWSTDGQTIVFADSRDGVPCCSTEYNVEIYVMNADGSGVMRPTSNPAHDYQPVWSP